MVAQCQAPGQGAWHFDEGPYRAIRVDDQEYLLHLVRYIHLNPVMAGLVRDPGDWPFSDFNQWAGRVRPVLGDRELRRELFPQGSGYAAFVAEHLADGEAAPGLKRYLFNG